MARAEGGAPLRLEEYAAGAQNETIGAALVSAAHAPARVLDLCPGSTFPLTAYTPVQKKAEDAMEEQLSRLKSRSKQVALVCLFAPPSPDDCRKTFD